MRRGHASPHCLIDSLVTVAKDIANKAVDGLIAAPVEAAISHLMESDEEEKVQFVSIAVPINEEMTDSLVSALLGALGSRVVIVPTNIDECIEHILKMSYNLSPVFILRESFVVQFDMLERIVTHLHEYLPGSGVVMLRLKTARDTSLLISPGLLAHSNIKFIGSKELCVPVDDVMRSLIERGFPYIPDLTLQMKSQDQIEMFMPAFESGLATRICDCEFDIRFLDIMLRSYKRTMVDLAQDTTKLDKTTDDPKTPESILSSQIHRYEDSVIGEKDSEETGIKLVLPGLKSRSKIHSLTSRNKTNRETFKRNLAAEQGRVWGIYRFLLNHLVMVYDRLRRFLGINTETHLITYNNLVLITRGEYSSVDYIVETNIALSKLSYEKLVEAVKDLLAGLNPYVKKLLALTIRDILELIGETTEQIDTTETQNTSDDTDNKDKDKDTGLCEPAVQNEIAPPSRKRQPRQVPLRTERMSTRRSASQKQGGGDNSNALDLLGSNATVKEIKNKMGGNKEGFDLIFKETLEIRNKKAKLLRLITSQGTLPQTSGKKGGAGGRSRANTDGVTPTSFSNKNTFFASRLLPPVNIADLPFCHFFLEGNPLYVDSMKYFMSSYSILGVTSPETVLSCEKCLNRGITYNTLDVSLLKYIIATCEGNVIPKDELFRHFFQAAKKRYREVTRDNIESCFYDFNQALDELISLGLVVNSNRCIGDIEVIRMY